MLVRIIVPRGEDVSVELVTEPTPPRIIDTTAEEPPRTRGPVRCPSLALVPPLPVRRIA